MVILQNVFNLQLGNQGICFPLTEQSSILTLNHPPPPSLQLYCLTYNVALAQCKGYFAQFKHSIGWRGKTCKAVPLEWLDCTYLKWLHLCQLFMPSKHFASSTRLQNKGPKTSFGWGFVRCSLRRHVLSETRGYHGTEWVYSPVSQKLIVNIYLGLEWG